MREENEGMLKDTLGPFWWKRCNMIVKNLSFILILVLYLLGCASSNNQSRTDRREASDALGKFSRDVGLAMLGYDLQCVNAIEEMEKEGKLSRGQAQYLINRECKNVQMQPHIEPSMQPHMRLPSVTCPICGEIGAGRTGFHGFYYVCPRGHAWR
jgi:hypothetical protein